MGPILLSIVLVVSADPLSKEGKTELKALQGDWVVVRLDTEGKSIALGKNERWTLTIRGRKWLYNNKEEGEITALDPTLASKILDVKSTKKGDQGKIIECVYERKGDTLRISAYVGKGKSRPTSFATPKDDSAIVLEFKRVKK